MRGLFSLYRIIANYYITNHILILVEFLRETEKTSHTQLWFILKHIQLPSTSTHIDYATEPDSKLFVLPLFFSFFLQLIISVTFNVKERNYVLLACKLIFIFFTFELNWNKVKKKIMIWFRFCLTRCDSYIVRRKQIIFLAPHLNFVPFCLFFWFS